MDRYVVLADIHANARALRAVLRDAAASGPVRTVWVLGDVVGYGAEPNECIELLRDYACVSVAGNHDLGAIGRADLSLFNANAAAACAWTSARLSSASVEFLSALAARVEAPPFLLVHGSPAGPTWEYVVSAARARELSSFCPLPHCLVGHTHVPAAFRMDAAPAGRAGVEVVDGVLSLRQGRFLVNPGSVGQPRDGDPRAAYADVLVDDLTVHFRRVAYDVAAAAASIVNAGLPEMLGARLRVGC
ncbi:MAG: metallophosphatase family protein [Dehalococcoidia bacterium]|jgi:diadenosine tetraphosphatase ApaH/serine/threonine PP2A family protein phosphatase|nr:metallophosphatase family protein [Dehalococcoidia bacterium]